MDTQADQSNLLRHGDADAKAFRLQQRSAEDIKKQSTTVASQQLGDILAT